MEAQADSLLSQTRITAAADCSDSTTILLVDILSSGMETPWTARVRLGVPMAAALAATRNLTRRLGYRVTVPGLAASRRAAARPLALRVTATDCRAPSQASLAAGHQQT